MKKLMLAAVTVLSAGAAQAQEIRRPDPTDAGEKVPPVEYGSAFADYRPYGDEKLVPWRESNEAVRRGGHEGRAAQPAEAARPQAKPLEGERHGGHR